MRLTEKDITYAVSSACIEEMPDIIENKKYIGIAIQKLGQLEDIEDELGIDLITLFKAIKNGVWVKTALGQVYKSNVKLYDLSIDSNNKYIDWCFLINNYLYRFDLYGKIWALTPEELL